MSHNERNSPSKAVKEEKLTKIMKRAADVIVQILHGEIVNVAKQTTRRLWLNPSRKVLDCHRIPGLLLYKDELLSTLPPQSLSSNDSKGIAQAGFCLFLKSEVGAVWPVIILGEIQGEL